MRVTPFPPPGGRGPWPEGAEEVLVEILFGFRRMSRLTFRQDVLETMGASAKARGIQGDIREDDTPRPHLREILRAIHASRDPRAALDALAEALEELTRDQGAQDWLDLARRVLNRGDDLPRGELIAVIGELHTIQPPKEPAGFLPEDTPGLRQRATAGMTLPAVLDLLLNRIGDDPLGPLVLFLRALADSPEAGRQHPLPVLRRFLAAHADRAPAPAAVAGVPGERLIVQIRLDEEGPAHSSDTQYRLHVSYYRQPLTGGPFRRVGSHHDDRAFTRSELLSSGGARLAAWKELNLAFRTSDPVRIEFLLPRSILGYTAELWSTGATRRPLGEFHPVVVRQLERYCEPHLGLALWRRRWANLQTQGVDSEEVLERIEWPALDRASAKKLLGWVTDRQSLACLGLTVPYEQLDPEVQYAVDNTMYYGGVPVLIWRRVAGDPDPLVTALRELEPTRLAELPDAVHRYRLEVGGPEPDPDRTVTLLWDDPDCVDPDQDYSFPGIVG
ncbi:hypothetical protein ACIQ9P_05560 [Kitasatospora sp. NPDC094019]|uniref:VMAP-C domain-containing protein n=1 Tax=Kitasatospora sp. NPDC094019 TaxID=3364091 RepID=UPI0038066C75